jgi:type III pantothenate kinase
MENNLAIAIGNTRIRAAIFRHGNLMAAYAFDHGDQMQALRSQEFGKIAIASVVPEVTTVWHNMPQVQIVTAAMIPIVGIYSSMGIDRVLCGWGACITYGCPVLIIDAGTGLSLTAIADEFNFWGGAILPGLSTQLRSLNSQTAALPLVTLPRNPPIRWATDTTGSIQSGVIYTILAGLEDFIQDWRSHFPLGRIVFTGGDAELILAMRSQQEQTFLDPNLIFTALGQFLH